MPSKIILDKKVITKILDEYPYVGNVELSEKYGLSVSYLSFLGSTNKVRKSKKTNKMIRCTAANIAVCEKSKAEFIELFPDMRNTDLAKLFKVSIPVVVKYGIKYGLKKSEPKKTVQDAESMSYINKLKIAKQLGYKSIAHAYASMPMHEFNKIFKQKK